MSLPDTFLRKGSRETLPHLSLPDRQTYYLHLESCLPSLLLFNKLMLASEVSLSAFIPILSSSLRQHDYGYPLCVQALLSLSHRPYVHSLIQQIAYHNLLYSRHSSKYWEYNMGQKKKGKNPSSKTSILTESSR